MHEFIKYSVKLENKVLPFVQTNENNFPTDDPDEKELRRRKKSDWQAILADHQYGTHFFIYSKFIGKLSEDKSSFNLKSVQLFLQNYTGAVTIGLAGSPKILKVTPQVGEVDASRFDNPNKYKLFVPVQALNTQDISSETILNGKEGIDIHSGDLLESVAIFKPVEAFVSKEEEEHQMNPKGEPNFPFVDELFETRMGEDIVPTIKGDGRSDLSDEFQGLDSSTISSFERKASIFDLSGTRAAGAGTLIPCKPTNAIFHI